MKKDFLNAILSEKDDVKARNNMRFYKTGKGEYAEGDIFLGISYPQNRVLAKKYYKDVSLADLRNMLANKYHEVRACALLALVLQYQCGDERVKTEIYKFYLDNAERVNNWDLVDTSAPYISGDYAYNFAKSDDLRALAKSGHLWKERISIVSTLYFIKHDSLDLTFELCRDFLGHRHDLIRKASGWMLREAGKKDVKALEIFLDENISNMPRTTLRYAIERFPEHKRKEYLLKK